MNQYTAPAIAAGQDLEDVDLAAFETSLIAHDVGSKLQDTMDTLSAESGNEKNVIPISFFLRAADDTTALESLSIRLFPNASEQAYYDSSGMGARVLASMALRGSGVHFITKFRVIKCNSGHVIQRLSAGRKRPAHWKIVDLETAEALSRVLNASIFAHQDT